MSEDHLRRIVRRQRDLLSAAHYLLSRAERPRTIAGAHRYDKALLCMKWVGGAEYWSAKSVDAALAHYTPAAQERKDIWAKQMLVKALFGDDA